MEPQAAVSPVPPPAVVAASPRIRTDDYGGFRAVDPGTQATLLLRPTRTGLRVEREDGCEVLAWSAVRSVVLTRTVAARARIPTAFVQLDDGRSLDLADALAPGAERLPFASLPGRGELLRVERFRLLCAAIVAGAELAAVGPSKFGRAARAVPTTRPAPRPRILPDWAPPVLLLLSVAALEWVFDLSLASAVIATLVILAHEYGHVFAMKLSGIRVRGVIFLPFIGAGTMPEHAYRTRFHEALVHLAGPVTGLPVAVLSVALWSQGVLPDDVGRTAFWWAVGLNLANLLPLVPLDGGRILLCMTTALPRYARTALVFAPLTAVVVALVLHGVAPLAPAAALLLAFSFVLTRMHLRRHAFQRWMGETGVSLSQMRIALRDVSFAFSGVAREDVDGGIPPSPMNRRELVLVFGAYVMEIVFLAGACWMGLEMGGLGPR